MYMKDLHCSAKYYAKSRVFMVGRSLRLSWMPLNFVKVLDFSLCLCYTKSVRLTVIDNLFVLSTNPENLLGLEDL